MKKNKIIYLKYLLILLSFLTVLFYPYTILEVDNSSEISKQYDALIEKYESIKKVEQSDLKEVFIAIIDKRLKCYSNTSDYALRLEHCRKKYQYEILRAARENLKSSPSLGDFMLCVQDCPLSYSFCNGEDYDDSEDCREVETLCIENCLNFFWRGSSLSDTH